MATYLKQEIGNYRAIRRLFVIGLIGLIVAGGGIIWLLTGYAKLESNLAQRNAQLDQRLALYSGTWSAPKSCLSCEITDLTIRNDGLALTVEVYGDLGCTGCYIGTGNKTFTGEEPIAMSIPYINNPTYYFHITIILNNAQGTQLKVTGNLTGITITPVILDKGGS